MLQVTIPLALALAYWASGLRQLTHAEQRDTLGLGIGVAAIAAHVTWLWTQLDPAMLRISLAQTLSMVGLATAIIALITAAGMRGQVLTGLLMLVAGVATATALFERSSVPASPDAGWPLMAHVVFSIISYALLAVSALFALSMAWKERQVRQGSLSTLASRMPPLQNLDRDLFLSIGAGFITLSLAIFSGLIFVSDLQGQHLTHKTVLTFVAWLVFGLLLLGRWRFGWRGMVAVRWTLTGFVILALAYFGSRIVLELLLGRQWG